MGWYQTSRTFLREVRAEMKKVSFPGRNEVINTTIVVIISSVIFALFLFASDQLIIRIYEQINRIFGA
jgi:preprotein translocase subunit SecE